MFNTIRILQNGKPLYLHGRKIKVNLDNTVTVDENNYKYDFGTNPNYTRGGKCN